jgi:hypothetical protein
MTCEQCGLVVEKLVLRCPRCLAAMPLGCGGNCKACGKKSC